MSTTLHVGHVLTVLATDRIERERAERRHPAAKDAVAVARAQLTLLEG